MWSVGLGIVCALRQASHPVCSRTIPSYSCLRCRLSAYFMEGDAPSLQSEFGTNHPPECLE